MAKVKRAKKEWYEIIAPPYLGNKVIGETCASDAELLIGRRLEISAVDLTDDISKYYLKFSFRIVDVDGKIAKTEFDGSECLRDYIARMVMRGVTRVDIVQDLQTKDGKKIRVKSLVVLFRRPPRSVRKDIRKKVEEEMRKIVEGHTLGEFVNGILDERWKRKLGKIVRRIYPMRNFEIRKTEMLEWRKTEKKISGKKEEG